MLAQMDEEGQSLYLKVSREHVLAINVGGLDRGIWQRPVPAYLLARACKGTDGRTKPRASGGAAAEMADTSKMYLLSRTLLLLFLL
jgi:hypothetical protein